MSSSQNNVM